MLAEGRAHLRAGRNGAASDAFGRVLLRDTGHPAARRGLAEARAGSAEDRRCLDADLAQARVALVEGDRDKARELLQRVIRCGGDRDEALALLDRLEKRVPAGALAVRGEPSVADTPGALPHQRPARETRRALVIAFSLAFALLGSFVAWSWDETVTRLVARPAPRMNVGPPATDYPAPTEGEVAVARARELLADGEVAAAIAALARVQRDDPAYPFASRIRLQADRALAEQGREP